MSEDSKWIYYNHALLPCTAPHEEADIESLPSEMKKHKKALLARWTSDYDCGYETEWWYCVKDSVFETDKLDAKKRYCITRGKREFDVRIINPVEHKEALYIVQKAAFSVYPEAYRPLVEKDIFLGEIDSWYGYRVFGAFAKENGELCGYSLIKEHDSWASFSVQKTKPEYEKLQVNAALVATICEFYNLKFEQGYYLVDGERNISHATGFQGYLEKYFGFRKVYCKLNVRYRLVVGLLVKFLYPFRNAIYKLDNLKGMHKVVAIINMEKIRKTFIES